MGMGIFREAIYEVLTVNGVGVFARTRNQHPTPTPACFFLQKTGGGINRTHRWYV